MLKFMPPNSADQDKTGQQAIKTLNGYLVVEVLQPNINPISLATVMIYSEEQGNIEILKVLLTGINGKTETICVTGKDTEISPCGALHSAPFSRFTIRVDYEGYYTNVYKNVQVISDRTTVHTSIMTPLPFGIKNEPGLEKIYDSSESQHVK